MTETPSAAAYNDLVAKNKNLCDSITRLVDEKAELAAANTRLAGELKAVIAEKGELQKQLAQKSGMGIQENRPGTFHDLTPDHRRKEPDNV
jgi:hypothetical protein